MVEEARELDDKIEELERATEKYEEVLQNLKEQARIVYEEHLTLEDNQLSGRIVMSENLAHQNYIISGSFILNGRTFSFEDDIDYSILLSSSTDAREAFINKLVEGIYSSLKGSIVW